MGQIERTKQMGRVKYSKQKMRIQISSDVSYEQTFPSFP